MVVWPVRRVINTMKVSDPISDKLRDIKIQIKKIETSLAMNEMRGENNTFSMRTRLTHEFIYFDRFFFGFSLSLSTFYQIVIVAAAANVIVY